MLRLFFLLISLFSVSIFFTSCSDTTHLTKKVVLHGKTMGTNYHITLILSNSESFEESTLQSEIDNILKDINQKMSTYQSDSKINAFNSSSSIDWFPISKEFYQIVNSARLISTLSNGSFDITISPLVNLWGFGPKTRINTPKKEIIQSTISLIGYKKLNIRRDPPALKKSHSTLKIDLSSIAKGYAVDKISEFLSNKSMHNHLVEIGGEIKARGKNHSNKFWRIAIENPNLKSKKFNGFINLDDTAVATSGDYRNFFVENNERLSHIINPKTGYPIKHRLVSVTVIHESAMLADAWATALMVLGEEKGKELVLTQGLSVQMIIKSGDEFIIWKNKIP